MGKVDLKEVRPGSGGPDPASRRMVFESDKMEVARVFYPRGEASEEHAHPEEQTVFIEAGRVEVTLGAGESAQTYVVEPGQASFHGAEVPHRLRALEDACLVSFKNLIGPSKDGEAGRLE